MRALLDINVLLALLDADHVDHAAARSWLSSEIESGWASCVLTQNGLVRVMSQSRYPGSVSPSEATERLRRAAGTRHHAFWASDLSLLDDAVFDCTRIHGPRQVTAAYLLALAVTNNGRFVTFDQAIPLAAVRGATAEHLEVL